ncbi:MAG: hypothetical protein ICV66_10175 [Chitinophagaceae bacterium]|nr:hypothetical protein [Chitinophagaceae bacterium]
MQKIIDIMLGVCIGACSYSQTSSSDETRLRTIENIWHQAYVDKNSKPLDSCVRE